MSDLDSRLLEILACPCPEHGGLTITTSPSLETQLSAKCCGRVFAVREGIPVLLLDEALETPAARPEPEKPSTPGGA